MQKYLKRIQILICIVFISFLCVGKAEAVRLDFVPSTSSIFVGDIVEVDVVISELVSENLGVFDFDVSYDFAVLAFDGYTLGEGLGSYDFGEALDFSGGEIFPGIIHLSGLSVIDPDFDIFYGNTFFQDQSPTLTLATLSFTGSATGTSALSLIPYEFGDEYGASITIAPLTDGSIEVSAPVPEPSTIIILGIGLLSFAGISRRKIS